MAKRDAKKFVDLTESDPKLQAALKRHWARMGKAAEGHGLKFTRAELHEHLRERWGITKAPTFDSVDTCTLI